MSDNCGGHIHIGKNYLTMDQSWENLGNIWCNTEKIIYIISNKAGELPRNEVNQIAKSFSKVIEESINSEIVSSENEKNIKAFLRNVQYDRYYGINFKKSDTIEFRLANGTLDANTWIENINLFGGIVKISQDIAIIQKKHENERTQEERSLLKTFEEINKDKLSDYEKLEKLLTLAIPEEYKDIYRERYEINSKLLEKDSKLCEEFSNNFAKSEISINQIGRKIFLGDDGITGKEYMDGVRIIIDDIREETLENRDI